MIKALSEKQEQQLIEFREHCLNIGLSTQPILREKSQHWKELKHIYKNYLPNKELRHIWYVDSPFMMNLVFSILSKSNLSDNLRDNLWANLRDNLSDNLWDNLRANLSANLSANLCNNLRDNLSANLSDNLWDNLSDNFRANLWNNLSDNLRANLEANLRVNLWNNLSDNLSNNLQNVYWGNVDIYWLSFYLFPSKYLKIKYSPQEQESLDILYSLFQKVGFMWFYNDVCFICDHPIEIHKKGIHLHADGKPALLYRDGYCLWILNGVMVPKELVITSAEKLDPRILLKEKNVEIRREIVRKIGIERVCQKLGAKCIDKTGVYELLLLDIGDGKKRPYLKMRNPSLGTYHLEGVFPDCKNVAEAIRWRNQSEEKPEILT